MQKQIIEEIAQYLGVSVQDIDMLSSLKDDLGLSPVESSDLLSHLSATFKVAFNPAEVEGLKTVSDVVVMIEDLSLE